MIYNRKLCIDNVLITYVPVLVNIPSAITIASHWSAILSGWIVQVTVMLYSSLVTSGETNVTVVLVTEEAIGHKWRNHTKQQLI